MTRIPETPNTNSPPVWRDETNGDLIVQNSKAPEEDHTEAEVAGSVPGRHPSIARIPGHEAIVRLPASTIPALKAALG